MLNEEEILEYFGNDARTTQTAYARSKVIENIYMNGDAVWKPMSKIETVERKDERQDAEEGLDEPLLICPRCGTAQYTHTAFCAK